MLRTVTQGFEVNQETLALDVIDRVGPRRHFLTEEHTIAHLRQIWQPGVIDRQPWDDWHQQGRPTPADHARQKARDLLAHHPAAPPAAARIGEIIAEYEKMLAG